ncbi:hypothetical protein [Streptomyces fuscigenes]|uniref:hypothetical protein n=1 Tax=Streptomyces fuscigenes TaxID=1528880 RepID=UPI001F1B42D9|nr:hypothetical protein [Streptomyces fuscigenes]MCF3960244.1 hypothetical protein [Streptomyces fuscigenes]
MTSENTLPGPGFAVVHITAATPDAARLVAQTLRARFASTEQRSYPAGEFGTGTRLELILDTIGVAQAHQDRPSVPVGSAVAGARQIWP